MSGAPHGIALGPDGTAYVGLADEQAVVAIDPLTGANKKRVVLDSPDIAATKELVTMRTDRAGKRLYIANGSDESVTILSLPALGIIREITIEGEQIRDAIPDPRGRYLYVLGRRLHVFDAEGQSEIRTIEFEDPMAVAVSANGSVIAVVGSEDFGGTTATVVALYETESFSETARDPLQTDKVIEAALFADSDRVLVAVGREYLYEKSLVTRKAKTLEQDKGQMRMKIDFGDLVNSDRICLPEKSGPQIAALASENLLLLAERRCSSSGSFTASARRVIPASLYGVDVYALAYDPVSKHLYATDTAGYLTIYKVPRTPIVR